MNRSIALIALNYALITGCTLPAFSAAHPPLIPQPREFAARPDVSLKHGVSILVPGHDSDDEFAA
ncbi:MAG TPA: hypothetical protein VGT04_03890, partial [Acidobacteriaceae bacterium]|nr:hypothetical protein [Acidobacteriaceae bacterium]